MLPSTTQQQQQHEPFETHPCLAAATSGCERARVVSTQVTSSSSSSSTTEFELVQFSAVQCSEVRRQRSVQQNRHSRTHFDWFTALLQLESPSPLPKARPQATLLLPLVNCCFCAPEVPALVVALLQGVKASTKSDVTREGRCSSATPEGRSPLRPLHLVVAVRSSERASDERIFFST